MRSPSPPWPGTLTHPNAHAARRQRLAVGVGRGATREVGAGQEAPGEVVGLRLEGGRGGAHRGERALRLPSELVVLETGDVAVRVGLARAVAELVVGVGGAVGEGVDDRGQASELGVYLEVLLLLLSPEAESHFPEERIPLIPSTAPLHLQQMLPSCRQPPDRSLASRGCSRLIPKGPNVRPKYTAAHNPGEQSCQAVRANGDVAAGHRQASDHTDCPCRQRNRSTKWPQPLNAEELSRCCSPNGGGRILSRKAGDCRVVRPMHCPKTPTRGLRPANGEKEGPALATRCDGSDWPWQKYRYPVTGMRCRNHFQSRTFAVSFAN